ncbi:hypothetical protein Lesp02_02990 [Lentzea sp. NBRC 105346]|nr:hypothetical protein Lesp02_02990 [Lentzea sp. NBRC 105346]
MTAALDRLLDRLANSRGEPLGRESRDRITKLDAEPSPLAWNDAYAIRIGTQPTNLTLWTAIQRIDRRCPRAPLPGYAIDNPRRWNGYYPNKLTVRIALRLAGDVHVPPATAADYAPTGPPCRPPPA